MKIRSSVALVTGANRGIGEQYVRALLDAGCAKIYAAAREKNSLSASVEGGDDRITPIALDITNAEEVKSAAQTCSDVNLLINNAGVNFNTPLVGIDRLENARMEMETNYFGTLAVCKAFAPVLKANGGGAIVNMLTILSRVPIPLMGSYCASKAAGLSMTQGVRAELAGQGTLVVAVMPGAVDTRMSEGFQGPKMEPRDVTLAALKAVEEGTEEVYPGEMASGVAQGLANDPKSVEKEFAQYLPQ